ncbi:MAG: DUF4383 domain-containing protein [Candidatus Peribacter sp.]|jgi:hypothetical protein|nr:DUF4383 domain-containing protein [Candidatus Peribacter sp.]MBT4393498.1 DUF4383 domain-containing protein [Candidatus Peribacter sp.]MBT4601285.1 DUF4383 domain-containing protein [Candidatus Peribacter sp.]MBT5149334.1 DUF4383 domain-containing protein [Candidatus Peribacter sp.]MBT5638238.1 DUF4383 domain-containing protein [Candidatus Peribacter sp.]
MKSLVRPITQLLGVAFTLLGIAGFFMGSVWVFDGEMNQNLLYIATGIIGLWAASSSKERFFLLLVAVVYAAIAILGFLGGDILGLFSASDMETYVHCGVAVVALVLGTSRKN